MPKLCHVLERQGPSAALAVDRNAKVIRGVRVMGLQSRNSASVLGLDPREFGTAVNQPYHYDAAAVRRAIPLYEGVAVNLDHPETETNDSGARVIKPGGRTVVSRFGRLVNVRFTGDGLTADLEYLASHPAAEMVLEMASRMPEQVAMSHNASCNFALVNGRVTATEIRTVRSVDLIGDKPGTTRSLFESLQVDYSPTKPEDMATDDPNYITPKEEPMPPEPTANSKASGKTPSEAEVTAALRTLLMSILHDPTIPSLDDRREKMARLVAALSDDDAASVTDSATGMESYVGGFGRPETHRDASRRFLGKPTDAETQTFARNLR